MQVFKAFFKITKKNLTSLIIYFGIFSAIVIIFSNTENSDLTQNFEMQSLDITIIDEDQSISSKALTEYIGSIHNIIKLPNNKEKLQDELYYQNIDYILYIPKNFEQDQLNGEIPELKNVKRPGSIEGNFVDQQLEWYINMCHTYLKAGYSLEDTADLAKEDIKKEVNVTLTKKQDETSDAYFFYQYIPYVLLSISIIGLSPILMTFRKTDIKKRNVCSSTKLSAINIQIILGCLCFILICYLGFTVMAYILYGKDTVGIPQLLRNLNTGIFALIAMSISFLLSFLAKNMNVLQGMTNALALGMSFLGGCFVPQNFMDEKVLLVAKFIPTYWYVKANDTIEALTQYNWGQLTPVLQDFGIQVIFAVAIFAIALAISKMQVQSRA